MSAEGEYLCKLRNQVEALVRAKRGWLAELAKHLGRPPQRVSEWVTQRTKTPNGDITLRMQEWAAKKTRQIAVSNKPDLQAAYRAAFLRVSEEHPVNGSNGKATAE